MKGNKKVLTLAVLVLLLTVCFGSYAIYRSSATGTGSLKAAAWSVKVKGTAISSANFDFDFDDIKEIKEVKRARLTEYKKYRPNSEYHEGRGVWTVKVDIALPCATQNELLLEDAKALVANGVIAVAEGAKTMTGKKESNLSEICDEDFQAVCRRMPVSSP